MFRSFFLIFSFMFFLSFCTKSLDGNKVDFNLINKFKINSSVEKDFKEIFGEPSFKIKENDLICWYYANCLSKKILSIRYSDKYSFLNACFDDKKILKTLNYKN